VVIEVLEREKKDGTTMDYENLEVWRLSIELTKKIYLETKNFPQSEIYGLTNQMRRAAVSIPSNISEGKGRSTAKDFVHFLHLSTGSLYELSTQIVIAYEVGYLQEQKKDELMSDISRISAKIKGLIFKIRDTD